MILFVCEPGRADVEHIALLESSLSPPYLPRSTRTLILGDRDPIWNHHAVPHSVGMFYPRCNIAGNCDRDHTPPISHSAEPPHNSPMTRLSGQMNGGHVSEIRKECQGRKDIVQAQI